MLNITDAQRAEWREADARHAAWIKAREIEEAEQIADTAAVAAELEWSVIKTVRAHRGGWSPNAYKRHGKVESAGIAEWRLHVTYRGTDVTGIVVWDDGAFSRRKDAVAELPERKEQFVEQSIDLDHGIPGLPREVREAHDVDIVITAIIALLNGAPR